jgi:hypothetical protein
MDIKNYSNEELQWFLENSESIKEELVTRQKSQEVTNRDIHVGGYYCVKISENTYNLYHLTEIIPRIGNDVAHFDVLGIRKNVLDSWIQTKSMDEDFTYFRIIPEDLYNNVKACIDNYGDKINSLTEEVYDKCINLIEGIL